MFSSYKVLVKCFTYNHSKFILDALNGFNSQITDFPYVVTIVDDASTDGNQIVILDYFKKFFNIQDRSIARDEETEYGHLFFAQHRDNEFCFFAIILLKENHYSQIPRKAKLPYIKEWIDKSKYIALCEGDDYWIDPFKLQKQVDFMDANPSYSMCSHQFQIFNQSSQQYEVFNEYLDFEKVGDYELFRYDLDNYFKGWYSQPLTCLWRNGDYIQKIPVSQYHFYRDRVFFYYVLRHGKGAMLRDIMGVYRVHRDGVWSRNTANQQAYESVQVAYEIYKIEKDLRALEMAHRREVERFYWFLADRDFKGMMIDLFSYFRKVPYRFRARLIKRLVKDFWKKCFYK